MEATNEKNPVENTHPPARPCVVVMLTPTAVDMCDGRQDLATGGGLLFPSSPSCISTILLAFWKYGVTNVCVDLIDPRHCGLQWHTPAYRHLGADTHTHTRLKQFLCVEEFSPLLSSLVSHVLHTHALW